MGVVDFFTNRKDQSDPTKGGKGVQTNALSLTKVGVAAAFATAVLGGLAGILEVVDKDNAAAVAGVLDVAKFAVLVAGAIAVADILVRGWIAQGEQRDSDVGNSGGADPV